MEKIGIMGGTFNPIHNGHLAIAKQAKEQCALDQVLFMPSGVSYMKDQREILPAPVRCEMTALAIREIPCFELSDLEAVEVENTYTCRTLEKLKALHPDTDYYFIMGADSLYAIEEWRQPEYILTNCTILAAVREVSAKDSDKQTSRAGHSEKDAADSGQAPIRERLQAQAQYLRETYHASVEILEIGGIDISSTQIRDRLKRGESVHGLVPKAVENYMIQNHLYGSSHEKSILSQRGHIRI